MPGATEVMVGLRPGVAGVPLGHVETAVPGAGEVPGVCMLGPAGA